MGVFGAMLTAVSGLRAQSYALENISGNIANSQTTGFKRIDTSFVDLIPDLPPRQALAGSVAAFSRGTNTIQGDFNTTGVSTNMALNGEGFFAIAERTDYVAGNPVFSDQQLFTRRGDFTIDRDGFLVNGAGYYLRGNTLDPVSGAVTGSNQPIRLSDVQVPARQTTAIEYSANLPSYPSTPNADPAVPGSEFIDPADFATDPTAPGATVAANDVQDLLDSSLFGGSIVVYNAVGAPATVQLRWAKSAANTWQVYYQSDANAVGAAPAWTRIGQATFNASGQLATPAGGTFPIGALTVNGVAIGAVDIQVGNNGLTQFADSSGAVRGSGISQDGYAAGTLERISVTGEGQITGTYSNGQVATLAQISIAQFNAANALQRLDGGAFAQTLESGAPIIGIGGSSVLGGTLEGSNTDIAEEFAKMIVTQQAYSANTRVVTTAQQMLQDVINIVR